MTKLKVDCLKALKGITAMMKKLEQAILFFTIVLSDFIYRITDFSTRQYHKVDTAKNFNPYFVLQEI